MRLCGASFGRTYPRSRTPSHMHCTRAPLRRPDGLTDTHITRHAMRFPAWIPSPCHLCPPCYVSGENLPQDKHSMLAEYYGDVQVVSVRAALWHLLKASGDESNSLIYLGEAHRHSSQPASIGRH